MEMRFGNGREADDAILGAMPLRVLVLEADRVYAEALRSVVHASLPGAFLRVGTSIAEAAEIFAAGTVDLVLTDVAIGDGDVLDLLGRGRVEGCRPRVLVVTARKEQRLLVALRSVPIEGVFDPSVDGQVELGCAIRCVARGDTYWSASVLERLRDCLVPQSICRLLTLREQLILAVIGDGSDNQAAADLLGLKSSTIASARRDLHRKLGVQHKGALVRLAVQHGFVRFTAEGVVRPGYSLLRKSCHMREGGGAKSTRTRESCQVASQCHKLSIR